MKQDEKREIKDQFPHSGRSAASRIGGGLVLLAAGLLLLAYHLGAPIPEWLFTWPMILILVGFFVGIKERFRTPASYILFFLGIIFLLDTNFETLDLRTFIAPMLLIGFGLMFILRPRRDRHDRGFGCRGQRNTARETNFAKSENTLEDDAEYLEINSVFGGVKKVIMSKNFKGGEVVCFMGGAELHLNQADIQHPIILEVNNIFGGTKLIVPSNWDIKNEVTAIFGGIDDKRNQHTLSPEPGKTVLLKGTCLFGGIEIMNY